MSEYLLKSITALFMALTLGLLSCCSRDDSSRYPDELKKLQKVVLPALHEGRYNEVIAHSRLLHDKVLGHNDTVQALVALYLAESYALLENADSARHYMAEVAPFLNHVDDPVMKILYYNIKGSMALKYDLDYPGSLVSYNEGYRIAKESGNIRGQIAMLTSIVYIYYVLDDPHGTSYAEEAKKIIATMPERDTIAEAQAGMALALTLATNRHLDDALSEINRTDTLIRRRNLNQLATLAMAVKGDILTLMQDYPEAEKAYREALRFSPYSEPSFAVMSLYRYGNERRLRGDFHGADSLYRKALDTSVRYRNLEFRGDILLALAKMHLANGDRSQSLAYFARYHNYIDSMQSTRKVQNFNNVVLQNSKLEKQTEVQKYKIVSMRTQRIAIVSITLLAALVAVIAVMVYYYFRRRKIIMAQAHRLMIQASSQRLLPSFPSTIVDTHYENVSDNVCQDISDNNDSSYKETNSDKVLADIFSTIDGLMRTNRVYLDKNLSLETMAELVGSNRTYVSKAVNKFSGISFSRYVNTYRIDEAIKILSNPDADLLIKELADKTGFSSDSAFSKIFRKETGMTPKEFRQSALHITKKNYNS